MTIESVKAAAAKKLPQTADSSKDAAVTYELIGTGGESTDVKRVSEGRKMF